MGARDTLRLEAGLCLYGNDIDETTTPIEASLTWTVGKSRRDPAYPIRFPGWDRIINEIANDNVSRKRVGLLVQVILHLCVYVISLFHLGFFRVNVLLHIPQMFSMPTV